MIKLSAFLILAYVSCAPAPAVAIELVGEQVTVTPQERHRLTECHRHGGCMIVTQAELVRAFQALQAETIEIAAGVAAREIEAAAKSCRRIGI